MEEDKSDNFEFVPIKSHPLWEKEIQPYLHKFVQGTIPK